MSRGQIANSPDELLSKMYPNIQQNFKDQNWLSHRAILASRNYMVEKLNVTIQKQLQWQEYAYKSMNSILNDDEAVQYPIEFLNSLQTPDLQAHNLILNVGAPIMLIRNIDAPRLCNGTRLIVKKLTQHVIQATVLTGCAKGENVFIPRKYLSFSRTTPYNSRVPFETVLCYDKQQVTGPVSWDFWYRHHTFLMGSCMWPAPKWAKRKNFCAHSKWNCLKCYLSHCFKINVPFYCMQINSFVRFYRKPYFKSGQSRVLAASIQ
ncbi:ATP-dependent DNA helicase [Trichonephila clavipes]|nr:ATP-dependent DNA helicase [Trichonephila clavipes]